MNYFAHAVRFLDDEAVQSRYGAALPYFIAGTSAPDWLAVVDRRVRLRRPVVEGALLSEAATQHELAAVARGALSHLADDRAFHQSPRFYEATSAVQDVLRCQVPQWADGPVGEGFHRGFIAHLLVEVLLDAALIEWYPARLDAYFEHLGRVDPERFQGHVNRLAVGETIRLCELVHRFTAARILEDYAEDAPLMLRLNQVMRRIGFPPLPAALGAALQPLREVVRSRAISLLGEPASPLPS